MSKRGNDLVRRYLWMAALSAVQFNPAVRSLYLRVVAKHPDQKAIAIGHAMRKLLHLVFAIWKTGKAFDPTRGGEVSEPINASTSENSSIPEVKQVAGLNPELMPELTEVTATREDTLAEPELRVDAGRIDFAHLKSQLPLARVLDHLGLTPRLKGDGPQRRCTCPIHRGDGRSRTFSVNLHQNVFRCFDAKCAAKGDVIDLWSALHCLDLRAAALDLVRTFQLEPYPKPGSEKRNG